MGDEIITRDQNFVTVLAGITDDSNQYIKMLRVDPTTKRLLVSATGLPGGGTVTSVSVVTANGFAGSVANPGSTPAITLTTTITGVLKGNGTAILQATAGTDYVEPGDIATSGLTTSSGILLGRYGVGSGAIQEITIGSGLILSGGGELSATGGGTGTVTQVSVVSANGFAGTVANDTTTPAITLSTTVTGIIKGNGTVISAAVAGTDYVAPNGSGAGLSGVVLSVSGTSNRITSTGGQNPVIDISASYVGQASITTLGTITSGVWSGTVIAVNKGGTNSTTALSGSSIMISNGSAIVQGTAGTSTTVLHGNASGAPTYGAVSLTTDVSGTLPVANGGLGSASFTAYAVICGGTTPTGALQSIASVGTAGQVLTSNGAGALPTFQSFSASLSTKNGVTTRTGDAASGTQNIAHGLGTTPSKVRITATKSDPSGGTNLILGQSFGSYDGTNNSVVWNMYSTSSTGGIGGGKAGNGPSSGVFITDRFDLASNQEAVITVDSTNIILTWTKTGSPTNANINILWEVYS